MKLLHNFPPLGFGREEYPEDFIQGIGKFREEYSGGGIQMSVAAHGIAQNYGSPFADLTDVRGTRSLSALHAP